MKIPVYKNNGSAIREEIHHSGISLDCSSSYYGSVYLGFSIETGRVFGIGYDFSEDCGKVEAERWIKRAKEQGNRILVCQNLGKFIERINQITDEKARNDSLPMHLP